MTKHIEWVASQMTRVGPVLAIFAVLVLAIILVACGPGNGGGSGY